MKKSARSKSLRFFQSAIYAWYSRYKFEKSTFREASSELIIPISLRPFVDLNPSTYPS